MTFAHIICFCFLIYIFYPELSSLVFSSALLLIIPANDNLPQRLLPLSLVRNLAEEEPGSGLWNDTWSSSNI